MPQLQNEGVEPADLSEAEQVLWKAFSRGIWVDLGGVGLAAPVIRAEVIAALLLGAAEAEPGSTAGIRLRGAMVTGGLDLTGATVVWPFVCNGCRFDTGLGFTDSSMRTVCVLNSELPAFDAARLRLNGILDLADSMIGGAVRLEQASVSGRLRLRGARAGVGTAPWAVVASGLSVHGDVDCAQIEVYGGVSGCLGHRRP